MATDEIPRNPDEVRKNKAVSKLIGKWLKTASGPDKQLLAKAVGVKSFKKAEPSPRMKMFNERSRRLSGLERYANVADDDPKLLFFAFCADCSRDAFLFLSLSLSSSVV